MGLLDGLRNSMRENFDSLRTVTTLDKFSEMAGVLDVLEEKYTNLLQGLDDDTFAGYVAIRTEEFVATTNTARVRFDEIEKLTAQIAKVVSDRNGSKFKNAVIKSAEEQKTAQNALQLLDDEIKVKEEDVNRVVTGLMDLCWDARFLDQGISILQRLLRTPGWSEKVEKVKYWTELFPWLTDAKASWKRHKTRTISNHYVRDMLATTNVTEATSHAALFELGVEVASDKQFLGGQQVERVDKLVDNRQRYFPVADI